MVVYENPKKDIQNIKEIKVDKILTSVPVDFTKMSVVFFLDEILYKSIKESTQNTSLFDFIHTSVLRLDEFDTCPSYFHLEFMLKLSHYLGFKPLNNYSRLHPYFDLKEGCFQSEMKDPLMSLDKDASSLFYHALNADSLTELNRSERNYLQDILLKYYETHLDGFGKTQSHLVLRDVLR